MLLMYLFYEFRFNLLKYIELEIPTGMNYYRETALLKLLIGLQIKQDILIDLLTELKSQLEFP